MPASPIAVRCGVSGWAFPHWEGLVYPRPAPRSFHPLEFLADRFDAIEIPLSFHQWIRPELARLWAAKVSHNPRFQFTARMNRDFTHERLLDRDRLDRFAEGLEPLLQLGRLGAMLMQFPSSFRFTTENKDFLIRLRRAMHVFPLVAELRHDSWASEEALGTLIDYHIGFCNVDQPESVRAMPPTSYLTWRIGYVKLHGRRCGPGFNAFDDRGEKVSRNDYLYTQSELEQWKHRITHIGRFAETVFVVFNNDAGGKAVLNALQMQGLMTGQEQRPPKMLARAYRVNLALDKPAPDPAADQPSLFSSAA
jgi:uncharacterized protein YecE (DUF72 family)